MKNKFFKSVLFLSVLSSFSLLAKTITSSEMRPIMLELYSSQGCSSCPPAEKWLNQLKSSDDLWHTIIPINFHVDYWDYLGWKDPFANKKYTQRQYDYQHYGHVKNIATPGFVVDGKGWNGWFRGKALPKQQQPSVGKLTAVINKQNVLINYDDSTQKSDKNITVTVAILGFDQTTRIRRGENKGKALKHNFVVLNHRSKTLKFSDNLYSSSMRLPDVSHFSSDKKAVVFWINKNNDPKPIQVIADWL